MRISLHIFLAYMPLLVGTLKTEWYVVPVIVLNALIQGACVGYFLTKSLHEKLPMP
jgi:hypothetical protein